MAKNRARRGVLLGFAFLVCSCGARRVYGAVCEVCGARPRAHEANIEVQRRRRLAAQLRAVETDPAAVAFRLDDPSALQQVFEGLDTWMFDFWEALNDLEDGLVRAQDLTALLHGRKLVFDSVALLRPWRGIYREADIVLNSLIGVWDATLTGFEATSMAETQAAQRELQQFIDTADNALDRWSATREQFADVIALRPEEVLFACLRAAIDPDSPGRQAVGSFLGRAAISGPLPPGVAEMLAGFVQLASMCGEEQTFFDAALEMLTILRWHAPQAVQILQDQFYAEQLAQSAGKLYRSSGILHTIATVRGDERMTADTALRHLHNAVESGTRHPLALFAALKNGTGYRAALRIGAARCVRVARDAGHHGLTDGLDLDVRNAFAHESYRLTEDGGIDVLNDSGNMKKHISAAQLVDLVTGSGILSFALIAGIVLFASESNVDVPSLLAATDILPVEERFQTVAAANNWPRPHISVSNGGVEVHVHGAPAIQVTADVSTMLPFLTVLTMAQQSPPEIRRVIVHDDQADPLIVDVALARETMLGDGDYQQALKWIRFAHSLRRGDQPATSLQFRRALILARAAEAVEPGGGTTIRRLLALRSVVQDCGDVEAAHHLAELIKEHREELRRIPTPPGYETRLLETRTSDRFGRSAAE